jgi:hypothetical protein
VGMKMPLVMEPPKVVLQGHPLVHKVHCLYLT